MKEKGISFYKKHFLNDISASIAVYLVAIPLCLGIAHASGAPLIAGIITGIIAGIVVGSISNSHLSVSGPAASVAAVVLAGITQLGSFKAFLLATFIAGLLQIAFGVMKSGIIADYIPSAVIKGMLSGIGLIIFLKQLPHMIGYDVEEFGSLEFLLYSSTIHGDHHLVPGENTFSILINAIQNLNVSILTIGIVSLLVLIVWDKTIGPKYKTIPGALLAVGIGTLISQVYNKFLPSFSLSKDHLVSLPNINETGGVTSLLTFPDWSMLTNPDVYIVAVTIALIASLATLLTVEAVDKIDPLKRVSPKNRELVAQGIGNTICGLIGGIPMTSVIVRSSVNVSAGGKTKTVTISHGLMILASVLFASQIINTIPLASLAAVLVYTGFKLAHPSQLKLMLSKSKEQLLIFVITITSIIFSDLLIGVGIGIVFSLAITLKNIYFSEVVTLNKKEIDSYSLNLVGNVSFFHKAKVIESLNSIPDNSNVEIDYSKSSSVEIDVKDAIHDFIEQSLNKNINVKIVSQDFKKDLVLSK